MGTSKAPPPPEPPPAPELPLPPARSRDPGAPVWRLDEDRRDEARAIAEAEGTTVLEQLRRRADAGAEVRGLRRELAAFRELIRERVQKPPASLLDAGEAARLLGMTRRALYVEVERHPTGPLAQAATRLGRRLRFSREGLRALLERPPLRRSASRGVVTGRAPSPVSK